MAALMPNKAKPIYTGTNIKTPLSLLGGTDYTLTLYPEAGSSTRGVLVVAMTLQFQFEDGESKVKKGEKLKWTDDERRNFAQKFVSNVIEVWDNKYRLKTDSDVVAENYRDVGVKFELKTLIDGWHLDDDYELGVKKIDPGGFAQSCVTYQFNEATLDSEDNNPADKGASMKQRGTVHEFGHMLGLRDEYDTAKDNPYWTGDADSVMNKGEIVRARHYAPFAAWLTAQFA
ncbi:MAG TPA: hypothetical protein PLV92_22695, partial [Pirellulaceae bacterium]|nr:hypothetical protein [Pirellulaceae bacterium]